jgi:hypothetical protein
VSDRKHEPLSPRSSARAVVDELIGWGHGRQEVGAGDKSLIEGILLQGIGVNVVRAFVNLQILIVIHPATKSLIDWPRFSTQITEKDFWNSKSAP